MDLFTLYVGQGALSAVRAGDEALVIDAHMPETDHVTKGQIEESLRVYMQGYRLRGLVLTGFDKDHAPPEGVDSILTEHEPDWIMYPKCFKDTDCTSALFDVIERHVRRRDGSSHPLKRHSVRLDRIESRYMGDLATWFNFELFSPHIEDMDSSNNSSIVLKLAGLDETSFTYLVTGDTESERWERINELFGEHLRSDVLAAPHHGSKTGVNAESVLLVNPNTVLISAGVDNQYGHPDSAALQVFGAVARHVFATNAMDDGTCLFTRRHGQDFETRLVQHEPANRRAAG